MSESTTISPGEHHHLLTTSGNTESVRLAPEETQQADESTTQARFTIPRKPLIQHSYNAIPSDSDDAVALNVDRKRLAWRPFYLKLPVLFSFLLFFCLLIVALETIYQVSRKNQGLVGSSQKLHYLWTYGPSAVMIVTAALWARVEYQLKDLTPWRSMVGKEAEATRSVLLDYVSTFQPICIYTALRNTHYAVASAAVCSLLLRVLVVFSTALLILIPVQKSYDNMPFVLTTALSGTAADLNRSSTLPFFLLNGVTEQGLQYPFGVTPDLAYQTFNSSKPQSDTELIAEVESLAGELDCKKAELTIDSWYGSVRFGDTPGGYAWGVFGQMEFTTDDCHVSNVLIDTVGKQFYQRQSNQMTDYVAIYRLGYCGGFTSGTAGRIVIAAGAVQLGMSRNTSMTYMNSTVGNTTYGSVPFYYTNTNFTMSMSTQFICQPKIKSGTVEVNFNSSRSAIVGAQKPLTSDMTISGIKNMSGWDYAQTQWQTLNEGVLDVTDDGPESSSPIQFWNSTVQIPEVDTELLLGMLLIDMPFDATANLTQDKNLLAGAQKYFTVVTALYTYLNLAQSQSVATNGTIRIAESRLQIKQLSVRVMEAVLAIMVILTIQIIIDVWRLHAIPRSPWTMISLATLLQHSRVFTSLLKGSGFISKSRFEARFVGHAFVAGMEITSSDSSFCIQIGHDKRSHAQKPIETKPNTDEYPKYWNPFVISLWGRICACIALLVIIIVLEILLALSNKNQGLSDASYQGTLHYTWAYVPAAIFVLVSLWFSAIDFNVRCMGPYFDLRKGAYAAQSVGLSYLDGLSLTTLTRSIKTSHLVVFSTVLASIIASNLTIAVSGLYVISTQPRNLTIQLLPRTIFASNFEALPGADDSATTAGLVMFANLTYPAWTYGELAFPELLAAKPISPADIALASDENGEIKTRVTATRSNLACQIYGKNDMTINISNTDKGYQYYFNISIPGANCGGEVQTYLEANDNMYTGYWQHIVANNCSQSYYHWGYIATPLNYTLTAMFCNETFNDVEADITLVGPSLAISNSDPPKEINSTSRPSDALKFWDDSFSDLPVIKHPENVNLDPILLAVVYGVDGIPIEDIGNLDKQTEIVDRIKRVNGLMRAQYFGRYLRIPMNSTTAPTPVNATYTQMNRMRLVQDAVATRILDGLLAVTFICTVIGLITADTRNVLPRIPCSIAARASLLADSSLITGKFLPENCQQMSDKELSTFTKGMRFRMGWFGDLGNGRVYKVDVTEEVDEESSRLTQIVPKTQ